MGGDGTRRGRCMVMGMHPEGGAWSEVYGGGCRVTEGGAYRRVHTDAGDEYARMQEADVKNAEKRREMR